MKLPRGSLVMRLVREPLVHFLLLGGAIFGGFSLTSDGSVSDGGERMVVTAGDVEQLVTLWSKKWQRPPTAGELQGLIDAQIREEVYYREALALGLDRDDTIVHQRLAQKFEFLLEDLAASREPSEEELEAYFAANRDRYRSPPIVSFSQVYFSPDRRGAAVERDARIALASLRSRSPEAAAGELGDRIMLETEYRQKTPQEIEAIFGRGFAEALLELEPGVWSGPVTSGYGLHLVRIDERIVERAPELSEVEEKVRTDWAYEQRQRANEAAYERLLARYSVVIEDPNFGAAGTALGSATAQDR